MVNQVELGRLKQAGQERTVAEDYAARKSSSSKRKREFSMLFIAGSVTPEHGHVVRNCGCFKVGKSEPKLDANTWIDSEHFFRSK